MGINRSRLRNAVRRGENIRRGGGLGLPRDPIAEQAAELGNAVIAEAMRNGESEDAAYAKGMRAGVEHYLSTPPQGGVSDAV